MMTQHSKKHANLIATLFIVMTFLLSASAFAQDTDVISEPLKVGIAGSEPFVFADSDSGIALEIWEQIAQQKSWDYEYTAFDNVDKVLQALDQGAIDVAVGPISITAQRLENVRFSQPFYNSSISFLSCIGQQGFWKKIKPF